MTKTEIRELNMAELEQVSGGLTLGNTVECVIGTTAGGNPGLYPGYVTCASTTWGQLWTRIQETVRNGGVPPK